MAVRGLSVITHKAAASLPNRNGVKVRLSSGDSILMPLSMMCRKNCREISEAFERQFFRRMCCLPLVFLCHSGKSKVFASRAIMLQNFYQCFSCEVKEP